MLWCPDRVLPKLDAVPEGGCGGKRRKHLPQTPEGKHRQQMSRKKRQKREEEGRENKRGTACRDDADAEGTLWPGSIFRKWYVPSRKRRKLPLRSSRKTSDSEDDKSK